MAGAWIYICTPADNLYFTCLKYHYEENLSFCFVAGAIE